MSKLDDLRIDDPPPRPRRRRYFPWFPVVFFLFVVLTGVWFLRDAIAEIVTNSQIETAEVRLTAKDPDEAERSAPPGNISAAGYLEVIPPGPQIASALVAGRVERVLISPGDNISAGQTVAILDTEALERKRAILLSRVSLAESKLNRINAGYRTEEIDQAKAEVNGAQAGVELAEAELKRAEDLYARGVIAARELDRRIADAGLAEAGLRQKTARLEMLNTGTRREDISVAEAELDTARTELAEVNWEIAQCQVQAPHDGVVLELFVQPGDWLKPGTDNPKSSAVLSCFDPTQIQAWVDVNQRDSAGLSVGQPVELTTDALPNRNIQGQVSRIMPAANLQKNTVQVKVSIQDPPADFRPELSVKVVFISPAAIDESGLEVSDE